MRASPGPRPKSVPATWPRKRARQLLRSTCACAVLRGIYVVRKGGGPDGLLDPPDVDKLNPAIGRVLRIGCVQRHFLAHADREQPVGRDRERGAQRIPDRVGT